MTRMLVCTGQTSSVMMHHWFAPTGLRRPYRVVTMDRNWFESAREQGLPRYLFSDKLALMNFVNGHQIICLEAVDGSDERISMGASMYAMGAKSIPIASDKEAVSYFV